MEVNSLLSLRSEDNSLIRFVSNLGTTRHSPPSMFAV